MHWGKWQQIVLGNCSDVNSSLDESVVVNSNAKEHYYKGVQQISHNDPMSDVTRRTEHGIPR